MDKIETALKRATAAKLAEERMEGEVGKMRRQKLQRDIRVLKEGLRDLLADPLIIALRKYAAANQTFFIASESWHRTGINDFGHPVPRMRAIALTGKGFCVMERRAQDSEAESWPIRFGKQFLVFSLSCAVDAGTTFESMKHRLHGQASAIANQEETYALNSE